MNGAGAHDVGVHSVGVHGAESDIGRKRDWPPLRWLVVLAVLLACLYTTIALLSPRFAFDELPAQRPIGVVVVLFLAAFAGYLFAIRLAIEANQDRRLLRLIFGAAILFRLLLLVSLPIQEVDIYRYLWDGAVSNSGVSPFRYSPEQVRAAMANGTTDADLQQLAGIPRQDPALAEILRRVHFGELPTIYPVVSQAVFALATWMTPQNASVWLRVVVMKACFIGFDLATLVLIIKLLQLCRMRIGLCLIYAWCPLLLKETANSGHLDAVAVFLTTLAVYLLAGLARKKVAQGTIVDIAYASGIAFVLALAVGAKLYPIILAPLFMALLIKRLGWIRSVAPMAAFAATTLIVLWPMAPRDSSSSPNQPSVAANDPVSPGEPPAAPAASASTSDPSKGLTTFLRRWEMNDFIFLILVENLKSSEHVSAGKVPWFSIIPDSPRAGLVAIVTSVSDVEPEQVPFVATRVITAIIFLVVAGVLAQGASNTSDAQTWCRAVFLTLAWFWLLCPTQNPWYWTWALPLLPFARSRAWLLMSGLLFLYYLRFWFSYHWPEATVLRTPYVGYLFFDFVVTWIEFAPWFVWLAVESWSAKNAARLTPRKVQSPAL